MSPLDVAYTKFKCSLFFFQDLTTKHDFNSLASGGFRRFLEKKHLNAYGFAWEFLQSGMKIAYNPSLLILWMTCWGFGFKSCDV